MAYKIRYSDESVEDIQAIVQHYKDINNDLVKRFREALLTAESDILRNPFAYSKISYKDFRRIIIKRFPYKITYRIENDIVHVFCVSHFARSNRHLKKRLKK